MVFNVLLGNLGCRHSCGGHLTHTKHLNTIVDQVHPPVATAPPAAVTPPPDWFVVFRSPNLQDHHHHVVVRVWGYRLSEVYHEGGGQSFCGSGHSSFLCFFLLPWTDLFSISPPASKRLWKHTLCCLLTFSLNVVSLDFVILVGLSLMTIRAISSCETYQQHLLFSFTKE